ncbi:hypothetical protein EGT07_23270 [Herbaspirillum sp. HC18]|nr:hypothetical protein EGT07_23270 [Herbaspirillum sp. HC18]
MRYLIPLLPLAIAACATPGPSGGMISIETSSRGAEVAGANCQVNIGPSSWNVVTPATINAENVAGDLRVVCNKEGYRTSETIFRPSGNYSGSSVGVGLGGGSGNVAGGVGLSFPISFGSGTYPSRVRVDLNPQ